MEFCFRPLRDDELLPVRKHRVVAAALKGEESEETEEVSLLLIL